MIRTSGYKITKKESNKETYIVMTLKHVQHIS